MKNLTLVFKDVEEVHLGKDVFLTPYYIAKEFNLDLKIVFPNTETNQNLQKEHRGAEFIRKNLLYKKKKFLMFRELNFFKYIAINNKKIDNLMLFHLSPKTMLQTVMYKKLNPKGKVYVKLDLNISGVKGVQNFEKNTLKRKCYFQLIKSFFNKVDLVSCETKDVYEAISNKGLYGIGIKEKIEYIPNGFDDELLKELNLDIKKYEEKENIMITVGRIGTYPKNNEMLLEAINNIDLKDWKIMFIGPLTEGFKIKYEQFIERNPEKKEKVLLIGNINNKKELFEYYNKAKVFLLTSIFEGSALVFPEALRFGNYILTTDVGGAKDITNNSKIGKIVPVNDTDKLKMEILKVLNNEVELMNKYKQALELSENKFLWSKIIKSSKKMKEIFG